MIVTKQFYGFFAIALAAVAIVASLVWYGNVGSHLVLKGTILKVRTVEASESGSLAVVDFRLKNPTNVPFVVSHVELTMEPAAGDIATSYLISKSDIGSVFQVHPLLGPKFNDVLSLRDKISPNQTSDWMIAAKFEVPVSALDKRKTMHLHIEDVDGTVVDFTEMP